MTLTINLSEKLETKLRSIAEQRKISQSALAELLLAKQLEPDLTLLESWLQESDPETITEQQNTWYELQQGLEQHKTGFRELFPPEEQGKSW